MAGRNEFPKGVFLLGLVLLLSGAMLMLSSSKVGDAPRWVGLVAGLMFFNAGLLMYMMDGNLNTFRGRWWFGYIQGLALLSIPLILLLLFNWVAFGPGERQFSISISIPFVSAFFERGNELIGRAFFAIPALLMDFALLGAISKLGLDAVRGWIGGEGQ
ncbi:MAG: hypothetical protein DWQ07_24460 [Chloroflexi bacterium]|nr:MAG: hypothetical protein DWQ07_24460 [Chloroflexota bacterium]MBL1196286.1 hypothetical protein [Chloroflexota bacterium]NOH13581.1 hypothetical protein [Chloroflexota bacterium]